MNDEYARYLASYLIEHQDDFLVEGKWHEREFDYTKLLRTIKEFNDNLP